jgi:hypothetical protein
MKLLQRLKYDLHTAAETTKETVGHVVGHRAVDMVAGGHVISGSATGIFASVPQGVAVAGGLGLSAAVSAGLVQMEYNDKCKHLCHLYKDEIRARVQTAGHKIGEKALNVLAQENRTIREVLGKNKRERNLGIIVAIVSTLATLGLMSLGVHFQMFHGMPEVPKIIAEAAVGLLTYNAISAPMRWVGKKLFALERETTHDRIAAIHKDHDLGKTVTREQVFAAFVSANKELDDFIVARFGKSFDDLDVPAKLQITENVGKRIHIDELTHCINHGKINATELAFAVEGQSSGVPPKTGDTHPGLLNNVKHRLHHLVDHVKNRRQLPPENGEVVEYVNEPAKKSFVERLGLTRAHTGVGHVERLEQAQTQVPLQEQLQ